MEKILLFTLCLASIVMADVQKDSVAKQAKKIATELQSYLPYRIDDLTIIHSAISNDNVVTILKSIDMATFATRVLKKQYEDITENEKKEVFEYIKKSFTDKQVDAIGACSDIQSRKGIDAGVVMFYKYFIENSSKTIVEIAVDKKTCKDIDKKPLF
ncbi:MAG: hypothetical protein A2513_07500 [Sulfurimonas sp. RIFOXYD12_FULL_33_39]|uniref:hypothetical protein n=1 Tax=unclassified Sulfurimonas TaxID=2623549 RepID=UPI0008C03D26|nr:MULTISPECIES: hypothetical protein [unclassified Sulfurimonas]OHE09130.1 MAG: hypothetical protein A2513_07500 [Sulfurimonas sp. RIFOXYD12_FULL_33_39]OHE14447.1 MAG: hypothetical protein A2530_10560 [Sulfurimonas sp. RIFOXYD2_FULL_34_21]DAB28473.1 MAG TPA: hypothetical protein CFH78_02125 [Sulfurimonas sp. UBA10385]